MSVFGLILNLFVVIFVNCQLHDFMTLGNRLNPFVTDVELQLVVRIEKWNGFMQLNAASCPKTFSIHIGNCQIIKRKLPFVCGARQLDCVDASISNNKSVPL